LRLSGSWERSGRNPLVGALVLVIGLGAAYMLTQGVLLNGLILADLLRRGAGGRLGGGHLGASIEQLAELYRRYRPLILGVVVATELGIFLVLPLWVIRRWHTPDLLSYLRLRRLPAAGLALSLAGTLFLLPVSAGLAQWLQSFFPALSRWGQVSEALVVNPRPWPLAATLLAIAVTPGLCEEVLFRGYLQRTLERRLPAPWHFLLSGSLFALFHQQVLSLPSLLLVGFYLGFVFFRFGSLLPTMLSHFLYNGILILLANFPPALPGVFDPQGGFRWAFVAGSAVLFAATIGGMLAVHPGGRGGHRTPGSAPGRQQGAVAPPPR
jgi:membrane protease YdiL (CAAX protease family)